jgi:hypothetical protein
MALELLESAREFYGNCWDAREGADANEATRKVLAETPKSVIVRLADVHLEADRRWRIEKSLPDDVYANDEIMVTWWILGALSHFDEKLFADTVNRFFDLGLGTLAASILNAISHDAAHPGPNWIPPFAAQIANIDLDMPFPDDIMLVREWASEAKEESLILLRSTD